MPRFASVNSNMWLPGTAGVLLLVAVAPGLGNVFGWVSGLGEVVTTLTAPPRAAVGWVTGQLRKPAMTASSAELKLMQAERDRWKTLYFQEKTRREQADRQLTQMSKGMALNREFNVRQITVSVIGGTSDASSGMFDVRAGSNDGVEIGTVATFDGVHLVGRVTRADGWSCQVMPVTDPKVPAQINGVIYPLEASADAPPDPASISVGCRLGPTKKGTLSGPVHGRTNVPIKAGMIVRLGDETWPRSSQMLVIGQVEEVQQLPTGREWIVVRPMFKLPLAEVTLRLPEAEGRP